MNAPALSPLATSRRLIIKIGSALLVDQTRGTVRSDWLAGLAADIARLRDVGTQVLIVTSGAVALGRRALGLTAKALRLEEKQAAAAFGQIALAHAYREALHPHAVAVAQILVTLDDTEDRRRHLNARATIETLLALGVVPVVNENDTVATAEIRFGDNDRLAARVAQMTSADTLLLLSDVDGLYTADPRRDPTARHVPELRALTAEILAMAAPPLPGYSSGGMITKLEAARIALASGCRMAIASGRIDRPLSALLDGARATWFLPGSEPLAARKRWIAAAVNMAAGVRVDDGAAAALEQGRSLLPAGITAVEGGFERGDVILVRDRRGAILGRGMAGYAAEEVRRIMGQQSTAIEAILGYRRGDALIHRDDLVLEHDRAQQGDQG